VAERLLMVPKKVSRIARFALFAAFAVFSSGCSTIESVIPKDIAPDMRSPRPTGAPGPGDQPIVLPPGPGDIDCPQIEIQDGTSAIRVGGDSNESVRYQFDITDTARQCQPLPQANQFTLTVGVAGRLLIGPAGSPGAYSASLRVVIRRESDQKPIASKVYRIESNTGSASLGSFQFETEPFTLPFPHKQMDVDYTILVGFDNGHGGLTGKPPPRRRRQQSDTTN
jgi:hypothetical protein